MMVMTKDKWGDDREDEIRWRRAPAGYASTIGRCPRPSATAREKSETVAGIEAGAAPRLNAHADESRLLVRVVMVSRIGLRHRRGKGPAAGIAEGRSLRRSEGDRSRRFRLLVGDRLGIRVGNC